LPQCAEWVKIVLVVVMTTYLKMISQNVVDVERRFKVSFKENAKYRKDIQGPDKGVHPLANYWRTGKGLAPVLREVDIV
jgi:hypothetical protein